MPRLSCITVTYGPTPSLWPMLESLRRTTEHADTEVIVVTQPDEHGSMAAEVAARAPDVRLIALDHNAGFGVANNIAAGEATSDLIAFLNPDLQLTDDWSDPLEHALGDPSVWIVAPPLLSLDGSVDEAGQVVYDDGGTDPIGGRRWPGSYEQMMFSRDVDYSSAACWMMQRERFESLGGFSPVYAPAYFEDVDLAFSVWGSGGRCRLVSTRPVIHDHAEPSSSRMALAIRSRGEFESRWATEIARQPKRLRSGEDGERVRDHRCANRYVITVESGLSESRAQRVVDEAGELALVSPTDRVTVIAGRRASVEAWRRRWCPLGLEIVVSDTRLAAAREAAVRA